MRQTRHVPLLLLTLALLLGAFQPVPVRAASLYFTAINDSMPPLTADTMPFWSGGSIYVPYTVFDSNQNGVGVSLGLYTSYNQNAGTVSIFNLKQMLIFDIDNGTCRDESTGTVYSSRAILRRGRPFLPLSMICSFFGLEYSYNQLPSISQGYLVRVKSADAVLDDALFIERARDLINNRLREYTQSLSPAESTDQGTASTPTPPVPPSTPLPVENENNTAAYLAFRCEDGEAMGSILDVLDSSRQYALFFLTPEVLEAEGDLVRRALGSGHSVGILAQGEDIRGQLARGGAALEWAAHTRTTLAYVPGGQRAALEQEGWVCWKETLFLDPGGTAGGTAFANSVLNRLGKQRGTVYLTLPEDENTVRVLAALLRQLNSNHFTVAIPMETRL